MDRCGDVTRPERISRSIRCPTVSPSGVAAVGGEVPEPYPLVTGTPSAMVVSRDFSAAAAADEYTVNSGETPVQDSHRA